MMDWIAKEILGLFNVPQGPPEPSHASKALVATQPAQGFFKLKLVTWFGAELTTALLIVLLLVTTDLPLVPNWIEEWLRLLFMPGKFDMNTFIGKDFGWLNDWKEFLPDLGIFSSFGLIGFITQASFSLVVILLRLSIRSTWYLLDETGIRTRSGIFTITEKSVDYSRIQSIKLKHTVLQGFFGLADIEIQTAAGRESGDKKEDKNLAIRNIDQARQWAEMISQRVNLTLAEGRAQQEKADLTSPLDTAIQQLLAQVDPLKASRPESLEPVLQEDRVCVGLKPDGEAGQAPVEPLQTEVETVVGKNFLNQG